MKLNDAEELCEAIDTGTEVDQDTWRWGSVHTLVFTSEEEYVAMGEKEERTRYWRVVYYTQPEMGLADVNSFPMECEEVEPYQETVTKYRRKA